jgi:hypothetical protein
MCVRAIYINGTTSSFIHLHYNNSIFLVFLLHTKGRPSYKKRQNHFMVEENISYYYYYYYYYYYFFFVSVSSLAALVPVYYR